MLLLSIFFCARPAFAEYRAFDLIITNTVTKGVRHVLSNFDPIQYAGYGDLNANEQIWYQDTWMCRGRTGDFAPICPNPNPKPTSTPVPPPAARP